MNAVRWLGMGIIVLVIGLFGFGLTRDATLIPSPLVGDAAPSFRLPQLDAPDSISLESLRGRAVVINYWASWCLACKQEHPSLVRAWRTYGGDDVAFVGVVFQDTRENARRYLEEHGGGWTQLMDPGSHTAIDFGVYGVPETFFLDQQGVISHKHIGPVDDALLTREIEKLLASDASAADTTGRTP